MPTSTFFNLPDNKKSRIEAAVIKCFTSMAYSDVSISTVIREADIPRGSFYQYFSDLDDMYIHFYIKIYKLLVERIYEKGILNFWYEDQRNWSIYSLEKIIRKKEDLIGKTNNDFILSIYGAPERVRDHITIQNAVTWSADVIKERMREAFPHVPEDQLDFYAFLYSMGDLLEKKYLDWKGLPLEEAQRFSNPSLNMIFRDLRNLEDENRERLSERSEEMR